jgi:hypothetical protein
MRTTLQIEDDVLDAARSLAKAEQTTVGEVISRLARKGLAPQRQTARRAGFPTFSVSRGARPITSEMVRRAEDDE